jgi:DNA-directed RNA polymerase specialized sigma24 family protein
MRPDDFNAAYGFPTTHWSMVAVAGLSSVDGRKHAMNALLTRYLPALRAHLILRLRIPSDQADDMLQSFISEKVLERNLIGHADRSLGKFRTFLCTALDRFVVDQIRKAHAKKRQGDDPPVDLEKVEEPAVTDHTSREMDTVWAREVLAEALRRMESACTQEKRSDVWEVFRSRVLDPILEGAPPISYEDLVARFGFESPVQASNVLITAKRMFARHLRAVVGEYAETEKDVDEEILDLRAILAASGARSPRAFGI